MQYQAITEIEEVREAFKELKTGFSSHATTFPDRTVGFQGGAHRCNVYWDGKHKLWGVFEESVVAGRYWICFGTENPAKTQNLTIIVEINPPKGGINRMCAGVFVRDAAGQTYIAHSGRIGGGRKGIGKKAFGHFATNHLWADVTWPDGKRTRQLIVSEVGSNTICENLNKFVSLVAEFKKLAVSRTGGRRQLGNSKRESIMTFRALLAKVLEENPGGLTPQQIRDIIKSDYTEYYGTDSHRRNVGKGHYKDLDHALLAQIYSTAKNASHIRADRTQKPVVLTLDTTVGSFKHGVGRAPKRGSPKKSRKRSETTSLQDMPTPTPSLIREYLTKWEQLENYQLQDKSLKLLFNDLCPRNESIEHILLKVSTLNDFYSTHIYDTYAVAKHIVSLDVDDRLAQHDYSLVNDIAAVPIGESVKNFYSFSSKFCSHHKPNHYPIYDSFVETMLLKYKHKDNFDRFAKEDLKYYQHFVKIIESFREFYGLNEFGLRDIDRFLWLAGKDWFPKNY